MKSIKIDTESVNAPEIKVASAQPVAIEVEGAGSTGYLWEVVRRSPDIKILGHSVEPNLASFGAAGLDRFVVEAGHPGSHALTLQLRAPWEDQPVKELLLTVEAE